MKDFPQQIFKNIPCVEGPKICQYLRRVEQLKDIKTVAEEISKDRKKRILEQVFTSRTGCQTWEELQRDMPSMQKKWKNSWVKLQ
uniref:Uncharacterized protein n=1 Tax=Magallana gigas TaxID=29159 RepID=A0A8W8I1S8_MAGGI